MYIEQHLVEKHFRDTEKMIRDVDINLISDWFLEYGYFPENNILPPTFITKDFSLQNIPYNKNVSDLTRRQLVNISYPKSLLTSRQFAIQHPWNYHDIVFYIKEKWDDILDNLYHENLRIYSYSLPIPVTKDDSGNLSKLRAGRLIYEWIQMAENDLVSDAVSYKILAKTDIANFYSSIYTHSVAWAIEGREEAFADKQFTLTGNKIDRVIQYANDGRTNGIPVGSALSDLIAEILLSDIDRRVSVSLQDKNFIAVRFRDDYRILCQDKNDAKDILRELSDQLSRINLTLNEEKTQITKLPDGLYRRHDREYFPYSLRGRKRITFKTFEHTLMVALEIHRTNSGTSILEKFLSELFDKNNKLKIVFASKRNSELNQIKKLTSLLFLIKRESEKILCHVLSILEYIYLDKKEHRKTLKPFLKSVILSEIELASKNGSAFEIVWYIFFSRYMGLGITDFSKVIGSSQIQKNKFVQCMLTSQNKLFPETKISLFQKPKDCKGTSLVEYFDVFKK
jgi:hypothetical protein